MKKFFSSAAYCDKTSVHHFEPGDRFRLRDPEYRFARTTAEGHVFEVAGAVGHEFELSHGQLSTLLNSGQLMFLWDRKSQA